MEDHADSFAVSCIGLGYLGWVESIFLDLRWVGLGWVTKNGPKDYSAYI